MLLVVLGAAVLVIIPRGERQASGFILSIFATHKVVLTNPQSYLCGFIGGVMLMPSTIGNMIWGVPFRESLGVMAADGVARCPRVSPTAGQPQASQAAADDREHAVKVGVIGAGMVGSSAAYALQSDAGRGGPKTQR